MTLASQESGSGGSAPGGLLSGEGIASCGGIGVDGEASGDGSLSNAGSIHGAQGQANASKVRLIVLLSIMKRSIVSYSSVTGLICLFSSPFHQVKKRFMCSLCGKRYFTVTALKKHHAMHGEGGAASVGGVPGSSIGSGGGSNLATMDVDTKILAKASSEAAAEPNDDDDDANAIDASILEIDGFAQVCTWNLKLPPFATHCHASAPRLSVR